MTSISTNPTFTPTQDQFNPQAHCWSGAKSRRAKSSHSNNGATIAPSRNCGTVSGVPAKTNNFISEGRNISDICADATFAAQTAAIELDLYLSWMARLPVYGAEPVKEVLKDYQPDFGDRDEVVARIEERGGIATNEELLFLRESTNWVIKGEMSPRMKATRARRNGHRNACSKCSASAIASICDSCPEVELQRSQEASQTLADARSVGLPV